jgi:predicted metal-dependent phosphoesterase TrpH
MIDLHCHSSASDGVLSPRELMEKAKVSGINYIALTDHDTTDGIREAKDASKEFGVNLISGVELSCRMDNGELHIVGLFIDADNEALAGLLERLKILRRERNERLIEKFNSIGVGIDLDVLIQTGKSMDNIGKPDFARYLYRKGYVKHEKEAYNIYMNKGSLADVVKEKIGDAEAIEAIHVAGGLAVLAHPDQTNIFNYNDFKKFIDNLISRGLDGLEVYYTNYNQKQVKFYKRIAEKSGLLVSGGSDFHDPFGNPILGHYGKKNKIPTELVPLMKNYLYNKAKKLI